MIIPFLWAESYINFSKSKALWVELILPQIWKNKIAMEKERYTKSQCPSNLFILIKITMFNMVGHNNKSTYLEWIMEKLEGGL